MGLTPEQMRFFDTFGYIVMPGMVRAGIDEIIAEFEAVFVDRNVQHDGTKRTCIVPFMDQREKLCALLDHPGVHGVLASLVGDDFNYIGSDGNYYTGDTRWHSDGDHPVGKYVKAALYLDPVKRDTGALRVMPGSHRIEHFAWGGRESHRCKELWGIEGRDVPALAMESTPGDVVFFDHNLMHAAFGGNSRRRMFTINCCRRVQTPEEIADLRDFISGAARFWNDHTHGEVMKRTASPARRVHLEQVIALEDHLPALAAKARCEMAEPARG